MSSALFSGSSTTSQISGCTDSADMHRVIVNPFPGQPLRHGGEGWARVHRCYANGPLMLGSVVLRSIAARLLAEARAFAAKRDIRAVWPCGSACAGRNLRFPLATLRPQIPDGRRILLASPSRASLAKFVGVRPPGSPAGAKSMVQHIRCGQKKTEKAMGDADPLWSRRSGPQARPRCGPVG